VGGASTTSFLLVAHFAKRNTKFGGGGKIGIGKRGQAKIPSPQPTSFLPACWKPESDFCNRSLNRLRRGGTEKMEINQITEKIIGAAIEIQALLQI
jgi:hypothetical protein